jgi:hypothetical protein
MRQVSNHIRRWLVAMALGATPAFGWTNGPNYGNGWRGLGRAVNDLADVIASSKIDSR